MKTAEEVAEGDHERRGVPEFSRSFVMIPLSI